MNYEHKIVCLLNGDFLSNNLKLYNLNSDLVFQLRRMILKDGKSRKVERRVMSWHGFTRVLPLLTSIDFISPCSHLQKGLTVVVNILG